MANGSFDRTIINPREKPLSSDINQAQSQLDRALRLFMQELLADGSTGALREGFLNAGLKAVENSPAAMSVIVTKGVGFQDNSGLIATAIDGVVGLDDRESYKPVVLQDNHTFTVPTAPVAPNTRIDIIEVQASYLTTDPSTRSILNETTGAFDPTSVNKIITWLLDGRTGSVSAPSDSTQPLSYKVGVAANPGVAPATTSGYIKLCEIAVGSGVTTIVNANITDSRAVLKENNFQSAVTFEDAVTFDGAATFNGVATFNGDLSIPTYANFKHGVTNKLKSWNGARLSGAGGPVSFSFGVAQSGGAGANTVAQEIDLNEGDRLTQIRFNIPVDVNGETVSWALKEDDAGTPNTLDSGTVGAGTGDKVLAVSQVIAIGRTYFIEISWTGTSGSDLRLAELVYRYDRP